MKFTHQICRIHCYTNTFNNVTAAERAAPGVILPCTLLIHRLPPWHNNLNLRWIKAAKLHFIDTGIVCALLGIRAPEQLAQHPLRGAIFGSSAKC